MGDERLKILLARKKEVQIRMDDIDRKISNLAEEAPEPEPVPEPEPEPTAEELAKITKQKDIAELTAKLAELNKEEVKE